MATAMIMTYMYDAEMTGWWLRIIWCRLELQIDYIVNIVSFQGLNFWWPRYLPKPNNSR